LEVFLLFHRLLQLHAQHSDLVREPFHFVRAPQLRALLPRHRLRDVIVARSAPLPPPLLHFILLPNGEPTFCPKHSQTFSDLKYPSVTRLLEFARLFATLGTEVKDHAQRRQPPRRRSAQR